MLISLACNHVREALVPLVSLAADAIPAKSGGLLSTAKGDVAKPVPAPPRPVGVILIFTLSDSIGLSTATVPFAFGRIVTFPFLLFWKLEMHLGTQFRKQSCRFQRRCAKQAYPDNSRIEFRRSSRKYSVVTFHELPAFVEYSTVQLHGISSHRSQMIRYFHITPSEELLVR